MRCSRRSTTSPARAAALLVAASLFGGGPMLAVEGPAADAARAAIERAVRIRFDDRTVVHVDDLRVTLARGVTADTFVARSDPGARLGRMVRFALRLPDGRFAGEAACRLRVETTIARTTRELARGRLIGDGDVEIVRGSLSDGPLKPPRVALAGARLTRDVAAGAVLTASMVVLPPLVRSGDTVTTIVRISGMEARGRGVASQSGDLGDFIRVVNPESRRALRARVVGRGQVEVVHGS